MLKNTVIAFLILTSASNCYAKKGPYYLLNFLLGATRYTPDTGPSSVFFQLGWTPLVEIGNWAVRAEIGLSSSRDVYSQRFMTTNYELFGIAPLGSIFHFEAGGGLETWHGGYGGTNPIVTLGFSARIGEFVDRLYINLSFYMLSGNGAKIWRAGYCFNF